MSSIDIIVGQHSILEVIKFNPSRVLEIVCTDESAQEFQKKFNYSLEKSGLKIKKIAAKDFQNIASKQIEELDFTYSRVPSNIFLKCTSPEVYDLNWLIDHAIKCDNLKLLVLDQVTDVNNFAAIIRTAAFYGVGSILISQKGQLRFPPGFYRIASGAVEHLKIIQTSNLSKAVSKLNEIGLNVIGFSEHSTVTEEQVSITSKMALVLGAEDVGLSNAVTRVLKQIVAFKPNGQIKSLNVSVAAAVAMEKFFK